MIRSDRAPQEPWEQKITQGKLNAFIPWHWLTVRILTMKMVEPAVSSSLTVTVTDSEESYHEDGGACCVILSDSDSDWQWGILPWRWWSLLCHPLWQWHWLTVRNLTMKMVEPAGSSSLTVTLTDSEESYHEDGGACCVILSDSDTDWQWGILLWRWWSLLCHPLWQWHGDTDWQWGILLWRWWSLLGHPLWQWHGDTDWQWGILPWRWWSLLCHPLWHWHWLTVRNLTVKIVEPVSSSLTVTDSGRLVILGGCLTLVTDMYTSSGPAEYTPSEASTRNVYTCAVPRHSNKFFVVLIIPTKINLKIRKSFYVYFGSLNKPEAEGITFDHIGLLVLIKVSIRILIFLGIPKF